MGDYFVVSGERSFLFFDDPREGVVTDLACEAYDADTVEKGEGLNAFFDGFFRKIVESFLQSRFGCGSKDCVMCLEFHLWEVMLLPANLIVASTLVERRLVSPVRQDGLSFIRF